MGNDSSIKLYNTLYHGDVDLSQYSFLITGGAGFIGSNLVEYLLKFGAGKVRALDDFSTGFKNNVQEFLTNPAFEIIEGDIRDCDTCKKATEGIDFVSHQAALGSVPRSIHDPVTTNEVNVTGFLNMLVAARNSQVIRMVYASSSSVYGDSASLPKKEKNTSALLSPYAVTKYANEQYAAVFSKVYGFHTIGLRYFNVFGPRQNPKGPYAAVIPLLIEAVLKKNSPFIYGDGETTRDFTFIENAVQANIKAMFCDIEKDEVVNIAFGRRISLNELWKQICKIARIHIKAIYCEERKGDVRHSLADITKAKEIMEYNPVFSAAEGLEIAIAWYKEMINSPVRCG